MFLPRDACYGLPDPLSDACEMAHEVAEFRKKSLLPVAGTGAAMEGKQSRPGGRSGVRIAMNRIVAALALSLSVAFSSALALAAAPQRDHAARHQEGAKQFPVEAAAFKTHMATRLGKAREKMEERLTKKQVPADKAQEIRAKFDLGAARVNEKVDQVCADGTVTKEEAKEVRQVARQLHPHKAHAKKAAKLAGMGES